jgi:hypothetical protein
MDAEQRYMRAAILLAEKAVNVRSEAREAYIVAVDGPRSSYPLGFHHTAKLTQLGFAFKIELAQNQPRDEIAGRTEASDRQRLSLQLFGALNLRLHPELHARPAGVASDGDHRRAL